MPSCGDIDVHAAVWDNFGSFNLNTVHGSIVTIATFFESDLSTCDVFIYIHWCWLATSPGAPIAIPNSLGFSVPLFRRCAFDSHAVQSCIITVAAWLKSDSDEPDVFTVWTVNLWLPVTIPPTEDFLFNLTVPVASFEIAECHLETVSCSIVTSSLVIFIAHLCSTSCKSFRSFNSAFPATIPSIENSFPHQILWILYGNCFFCTLEWIYTKGSDCSS